MRTLTIDGVEYEIQDEVSDLLIAASKERDELQARNEQLVGALGDIAYAGPARADAMGLMNEALETLQTQPGIELYRAKEAVIEAAMGEAFSQRLSKENRPENERLTSAVDAYLQSLEHKQDSGESHGGDK